MKKHQARKIVAYVYMPLIFAILGYGIVYMAAKPLLDVGADMVSLFMSSASVKEGSMEGKTFQVPTGTDAHAQPETLNIGEIAYPEFGDIYGRLTCDSIGLNSDVYYGDDSQMLRKGAGQYMGSGLPGGGRQILLSGHNVTIFAPLQDIAVGDEVTFTTGYGIYTYRITETKILDARDTNAYDLLAQEESLVMYTCYPFTALGSTNQRFFVYGTKILGPTLVQEGEK